VLERENEAINAAMGSDEFRQTLIDSMKRSKGKGKGKAKAKL